MNKPRFRVTFFEWVQPKIGLGREGMTLCSVEAHTIADAITGGRAMFAPPKATESTYPARIKVMVWEDGQLVFSAYGGDVNEACREARRMDRRSRTGGGR